jgi:hypothetical protein
LIAVQLKEKNVYGLEMQMYWALPGYDSEEVAPGLSLLKMPISSLSVIPSWGSDAKSLVALSTRMRGTFAL